MAEEVFRPSEYKFHQYSDVDPPPERDAQTICMQHLPVSDPRTLHLPHTQSDS